MDTDQGTTLAVDAGGSAIATPSRSRATKTKITEAKVVMLSSAKGGSAKTTTTRCLASFAAADGLRAAIIDLDEQRTLSKWWHRRSDSLPVIANYNAIPLDEAGVAVTEIAASGQHDIVFVDTPPGVDRETGSLKAVIRRSDLVLVPTTDGGEDLESVSEWMEVVRMEQRPAFFLLCKTDRKMPTIGEAKAYLSDKGRICPLDVRQSQAIKRSYFDGRGAADLPGILGQRAAVDYKAVWNFVRLELGMRKQS
jgi:chromosome partitioning protein